MRVILTALAVLWWIGCEPVTHTEAETPELVWNWAPAFEAQLPTPYDLAPDGSGILYSSLVGNEDARVGLFVRGEMSPPQRSGLDRSCAASARYPRWSRDGTRLAFLCHDYDGPVEPTIHVVDAGGRLLRILQPGAALRDFVWTHDGRGLTLALPDGFHTEYLNGERQVVPHEVHYSLRLGGYSPDGRWLAFHVRDANSPHHRETDVWLLPSKGGVPRQMTHDRGFDGWPVWVDSERLVFSTERSGHANLWLIHLSEDSVASMTPLTSFTGEKPTHPRPAKDGSIVFPTIEAEHRVHVASENALPETREVAKGYAPQMSASGGRLYYLRHDSLWTATRTGDGERLVAPGPFAFHFVRAFHASPTADRVAYFRLQDGTTNLYVTDASNGSTELIHRLNGSRMVAPSWSPDGQRLAFACGDGLYVIDADGGAPVRVASLGEWYGWTVRWSPDGKYLTAIGVDKFDDEDASSVYSVRLRDGDVRRLSAPEEKAFKEGAEWHPGGGEVSYMSYDPDGSRIASIEDTLSTVLVNLPDPRWDYVGTWSPSQKYYFVSFTKGKVKEGGLYRMEARGISEAEEIVAPDRGVMAPPSFARDANYLTFATTSVKFRFWRIRFR